MAIAVSMSSSARSNCSGDEHHEDAFKALAILAMGTADVPASSRIVTTPQISSKGEGGVGSGVASTFSRTTNADYEEVIHRPTG